MANLIDTSYFIGDIEIPNVAQLEIKEDVENSIKIYEREVLISLLGYPLYKELVDHTIVAGDKFDKLINGEDFSFSLDGRTIDSHWVGLKGVDKKSLIAYYVYFMHRRKRQTYLAGTSGEVTPESENSTKVDFVSRLVDIWNEFIKMYGDECYYGYDDRTGYFNLDSTYASNDLPSAFNYLLAKKADFPNWKFKDMGGEINVMGI